MSEPSLYQPLGNHLKVARNGTTQSQVQFPTEYPVTRIETIADGTINYGKIGHLAAPADGYELQPGDILYSHINSIKHVGKVAQYWGEEKFLYHGMNLLLLRLDDEVDKRYFFHFLNSYNARHYAQKECQKAINQVSLNTGQLKKLSVFTPPMVEQQVIAHILDTLDTQIRQTEALIAKLEQIKQGLLTDLLTRGIDENGELRPPPEQAPHLYKDSALGRIPRGWDVLPVVELGEIVTGTTPPSSIPRAWGSELPFITPADVGHSDSITTAERSLSAVGKSYVREIPPGTTLVVCIGSTIGKVGFCGVPAATNQQINALIPSQKLNRTFMYHAVQRHVRQILAWAGLQAVPIVNKTQFGQMLLPIAPSQEQFAVARRLSVAERQIMEERAIFSKLGQLKASLMNDLLTGRVRVTPLLNEAGEQATG